MGFSIRSSSSNQEVNFCSRKGDTFLVRLKGTISTEVRVSAYTDEQGLNKLFQDLGETKKPWQGSKSWESLEGEFTISVYCSPLGEVKFRYSLWNLLGHPEELRIESGLLTELGQLEVIANQANKFFKED